MVAQLLLNLARAQPNVAMFDIGVTPLYLAAFMGHADTACLLLEEGADPSEGNLKVGISPIFMAAEKGHREVVRVMIAEENRSQKHRDSKCISIIGTMS